MTVVGLDLSLTSTGMAGANWTRRIQSRAVNGLKEQLHRIRKLALEIEYFANYELFESGDGKCLVVVEGLSFASKSSSAHLVTGCWWLVVNHLAESGYLIAVVPPATLKAYALGYIGKRKKGEPVTSIDKGKDAMLQAATRKFANMTHNFGNDEADALWLCAMGYERLKRPLVEVPESQKRALEKVEWPV